MKGLFVSIGLVFPLSAGFLVTASWLNADTEEAIDLSEAWRVPFSGTMTISCAPDERPPYEAGQCAHIRRTLLNGTVVKDEKAIDYTNATDVTPASSFPVLAPADGTVLDVGFDNPGYGNWVRIQHGARYSFFAHLATRNVSAGSNVIQGQQIGTSGKTGLPSTAGIHLHFDARTGVPTSSPYSGNPSPVRAIPGNWFNTWYSPVPDLRWDDARASGGAAYPPKRKRPNTTAIGARHLSNQQSPTNFPSAYVTNIFADSLWLHFGAAPDTPNSAWDTTFITTEFYNGQWHAVPNGGPNLPGPTYNEAIGGANQSESNGQHTWQIFSRNTQSGQTANPRYIEVWPGRGTDTTPHFTAVYRVASTETTLEFCEGASRYQVWEYHGATQTIADDGPDCSIFVHRNPNGINQYQIRGMFSGQWSPYSPVIFLHF